MLIVRERNSEKTGRIFASKDTIDERGATVNVELTSDHYRRPPLVHSRLEIKCNVTGTVSLATPRLVTGINYNNSQNIWTYSNFHVKWNTSVFLGNSARIGEIFISALGEDRTGRWAITLWRFEILLIFPFFLRFEASSCLATRSKNIITLKNVI